MAIQMSDILKSPLVNDEKLEVNAKDLNLKEMKQAAATETGSKPGNSRQTTVITVKKTVVNPDGTKTEFDTKFELSFQSPEEMKEYLTAIGYLEESKPPAPDGTSFFKRVLEYAAKNRKANAEADRRKAQRSATGTTKG
jgi:hypothetical protein